MTDRKEQILDAAEHLLQRVGYAAFSYQDLADAVEITKASIHHHFPSKELLGLALIERYRAHLEAFRAGVAARAGAAGGAFRAFLAAVSSRVCPEDGRICPLGSLQGDFASLPPLDAGRRRGVSLRRCTGG